MKNSQPVLLLAISLFSSLYFFINAQAEDKVRLILPDTEIYLFDVIIKGATFELKNAKNISAHSGYDNQPFFTPGDRSILFTSARDGKQTDIYEYIPVPPENAGFQSFSGYLGQDIACRE